MSGGSEDFSSLSAVITARVTCRVSAPGCLLIVKTTAGPPANSPFSRRVKAELSPRRSCGPSMIRATCESLTD